MKRFRTRRLRSGVRRNTAYFRLWLHRLARRFAEVER